MISDLSPLATGDSIPTMSSLQIAEITGKPHRNVTGDIARILSEAEIDAQGFLHIYTDTQNREQKCYHLPRRECDLVISGYSVKYRLAIIDRWQELEKQIAAPSLPEMLRIAASAMEENERLKVTVSEQVPKVEFFDRVTESATDCSMATAAQVCKLPYGQNTLFKKLRELGVLISGGSRHNLPKQYAIEQGLFLVTEAKFLRDNETEICFTTKVTQKGIAWIIKHLGKQEVAK